MNLGGAFVLTQLALTHMIPAGRGRIINITSYAGVYRWPLLSAYAASKAALVKLTETLAEETRPHGVSVFSVDPGLLPIGLGEAALKRQRRPADAGRPGLRTGSATSSTAGRGADPERGGPPDRRAGQRPRETAYPAAISASTTTSTPCSPISARSSATTCTPCGCAPGPDPIAMGRGGVPSQILAEDGKVLLAVFGRGPDPVMFDRICTDNGTRHLLTAPYSPTTGKVALLHKTMRAEFFTSTVRLWSWPAGWWTFCTPGGGRHPRPETARRPGRAGAPVRRVLLLTITGC